MEARKEWKAFDKQLESLGWYAMETFWVSGSILGSDMSLPYQWNQLLWKAYILRQLISICRADNLACICGNFGWL